MRETRYWGVAGEQCAKRRGESKDANRAVHWDVQQHTAGSQHYGDDGRRLSGLQRQNLEESHETHRRENMYVMTTYYEGFL